MPDKLVGSEIPPAQLYNTLYLHLLRIKLKRTLKIYIYMSDVHFSIQPTYIKIIPQIF